MRILKKFNTAVREKRLPLGDFLTSTSKYSAKSTTQINRELLAKLIYKFLVGCLVNYYPINFNINPITDHCDFRKIME